MAQAWPEIPIDALNREPDFARFETLNPRVYRTVIQVAGVPDASFQRIAHATRNDASWDLDASVIDQPRSHVEWSNPPKDRS